MYPTLGKIRQTDSLKISTLNQEQYQKVKMKYCYILSMLHS